MIDRRDESVSHGNEKEDDGDRPRLWRCAHNWSMIESNQIQIGSAGVAVESSWIEWECGGDRVGSTGKKEME